MQGETSFLKKKRTNLKGVFQPGVKMTIIKFLKELKSVRRSPEVKKTF